MTRLIRSSIFVSVDPQNVLHMDKEPGQGGIKSFVDIFLSAMQYRIMLGQSGPDQDFYKQIAGLECIDI